MTNSSSVCASYFLVAMLKYLTKGRIFLLVYSLRVESPQQWKVCGGWVARQMVTSHLHSGGREGLIRVCRQLVSFIHSRTQKKSDATIHLGWVLKPQLT